MLTEVFRVFLQSFQANASIEAHSASYAVGNRGSISGGKAQPSVH
jgi:hypothetical protein